MSLRRKKVICLQVLASATFLPTSAWAHTDAGAVSGFSHGFMHPVSGIDHILAMVAVGLFAASLGGRALWTVPLIFMAFMGIGGALGVSDVALPYVETAVALSVLCFGIAVSIRWRWPVAAAMFLVGMFAIFHGHAHGTEMPQTLSALGYSLGFLLSTGALHLAGIAVGLTPAKFGAIFARRMNRIGGITIAAAGTGLLTGLI